jgi:hypothetical protein
VIELSFRRDLYSGAAVEEALRAFAEHAAIERIESEEAFVLRVRAPEGVDERLLSDELDNYVLGATIERRGE